MQVPCDILDDIGKLQPFAEAHADGGHLIDIPPLHSRPVRADHSGPEFANTSRDIVGVPVQLVQCGKSSELSA